MKIRDNAYVNQNDCDNIVLINDIVDVLIREINVDLTARVQHDYQPEKPEKYFLKTDQPR